MLEIFYNWSLIMAWMIAVIHGFWIILRFIRSKDVPYNFVLYWFLVSVAWLIVNRG
jgi:hypothetical protein